MARSSLPGHTSRSTNGNAPLPTTIALPCHPTDLLTLAGTRSSSCFVVAGCSSRWRRALSLPAFGSSAVSLVVAPILVGDDSVAYFLTAGRDSGETAEDTRIMVTEHAAMVSAVISPVPRRAPS